MSHAIICKGFLFVCLICQCDSKLCLPEVVLMSFFIFELSEWVTLKISNYMTRSTLVKSVT